MYMVEKYERALRNGCSRKRSVGSSAAQLKITSIRLEEQGLMLEGKMVIERYGMLLSVFALWMKCLTFWNISFCSVVMTDKQGVSRKYCTTGSGRLLARVVLLLGLGSVLHMLPLLSMEVVQVRSFS